MSLEDQGGDDNRPDAPFSIWPGALTPIKKVSTAEPAKPETPAKKPRKPRKKAAK